MSGTTELLEHGPPREAMLDQASHVLRVAASHLFHGLRYVGRQPENELNRASFVHDGRTFPSDKQTEFLIL